jgi:hypothetical protein
MRRIDAVESFKGAFIQATLVDHQFQSGADRALYLPEGLQVFINRGIGHYHVGAQFIEIDSPLGAVYQR